MLPCMMMLPWMVHICARLGSYPAFMCLPVYHSVLLHIQVECRDYIRDCHSFDVHRDHASL